MSEDWAEMEALWEPWETAATSYMEVSDSEGKSVLSPFTAYAPTFQQARLSMKLHLGILLREEGYHPSWLRED